MAHRPRLAHCRRGHAHRPPVRTQHSRTLAAFAAMTGTVWQRWETMTTGARRGPHPGHQRHHPRPPCHYPQLESRPHRRPALGAPDRLSSAPGTQASPSGRYPRPRTLAHPPRLVVPSAPASRQATHPPAATRAAARSAPAPPGQDHPAARPPSTSARRTLPRRASPGVSVSTATTALTHSRISPTIALPFPRHPISAARQMTASTPSTSASTAYGATPTTPPPPCCPATA